MKIEFAGKNLKVSDALREKVEKKLEKLEKFTGKMVSARITFEVEKHKSAAELLIHCSHDRIFKAKGISEDMYLAVNEAANAIEQQAKKSKGKIIARRSKGEKLYETYVEELPSVSPSEKTPKLIRMDEWFIERPISIEDALFTLEENKFPLVLFRSIETDTMCVLYKKSKDEIIVVEEKTK